MDYNGLDNALRDILVIPAGDPNWLALQESLINDAEGRIYKDMNFLGIRKTDVSKAFTQGVRALALPATLIICEQVAWNDGNNPASITALQFASLDFINWIWPQQATPGALQYWALQDDANIVVAGTPGGNYPAIITGKFRPAPMSAVNLTSYIGTKHPELLVAACMVFAIGYQRDFGSQMALNPQMGIAWESLYQSRLKSSREEEARKVTAATGESPAPPAAMPMQG